ncbi:MAG TPA: ABC transporter permease [Trebonia sp.]|nr:ABC transporter permease [Trebonia sp.]
MSTGTTGTGDAGTTSTPRGPLPVLDGSGRADLGTLTRRTLAAGESWVFAALIIMIAIFTFLSPGKFLTIDNFSLTAQTTAPFLVMAIGETFVIITAGIDLSVGFVLVLTGVVAGEYYLHNGGTNASVGTIWIGAILGILTGTAFGALQGLAVAKLKMPPLIATLMGLGVAEGLSYLITGGSDLRSVPNTLASSIGQGSLGGVQWLIIISFLATLVFGLVLAYTRFGRYTYAIGSNPEAAARVGINVDWHLIKVYALSGLTAGIAGIMNLGYFSTTTISGHPLDNLVVITAVVIGGASLFGGRGTMLGTFLGVFIPELLAAGLIIAGVNQFWQYILTGLVLGAAVYMDQIRRRLRERALSLGNRDDASLPSRRSECLEAIPLWLPGLPQPRPSPWWRRAAAATQAQAAAPAADPAQAQAAALAAAPVARTSSWSSAPRVTTST